jgi:hypothetical protein
MQTGGQVRTGGEWFGHEPGCSLVTTTYFLGWFGMFP